MAALAGAGARLGGEQLLASFGAPCPNLELLTETQTSFRSTRLLLVARRQQSIRRQPPQDCYGASAELGSWNEAMEGRQNEGNYGNV